MTNEEAIYYLKQLYHQFDGYSVQVREREAILVAIRALQQINVQYANYSSYIPH